MGHERPAPTTAAAHDTADPSATDTHDAATEAPQPFDFMISFSTPAHVAEVIAAQPPSARPALMARVHQLQGNGFAGQVEAAMNAAISAPAIAADGPADVTPFDFAIGGSADSVARMIAQEHPMRAPEILARVEQLRDQHFALSVEAALGNLTGTIRGFDLETVAVILAGFPDLDEARQALALIRQADRDQLGPILVALDRRGFLEKLIAPLPFGEVEALYWALPRGAGFSTIKAKMRPRFEQADRSDNSLGHLLDSVPGVGGALHVVYNGLTFGVLDEHDKAYRAKRAGRITEDEYVDASNAANRKGIAVGAASTLTGGAAGAYVEGATTALAATGTPGRIAANAFTGAAAGAGAGFGTQFGEDAYAGQFSSPEQYLHTMGTGAAVGAGFGAVGSAIVESLPVAARAYLAARISKFPDVFDHWRAIGERHAITIKRLRLTELVSDGAAVFASPQLAMATAGLAPDVPIRMTGELTDRGITVIKAERLSDSFGDDVSGPSSGSLFDDFDSAGGRVDDPWELRTDGDDLGAHADIDGAQHPHDLRDEIGMGTLSDVRLGLTREPRHHVLPQEEIEFFQARGFPDRAIDDFTIELPTLDHEMAHGGNQALARQHWPEREWNTNLMAKLRAAEAGKRAHAGPHAKLTSAEILDIAMQEMRRFALDDYPFVHYEAP